MGINFVANISPIVASTTSQLASFEPLFAVVGGLVGALVVITALVEMFTGKRAPPAPEGGHTLGPDTDSWGI